MKTKTKAMTKTEFARWLGITSAELRKNKSAAERTRVDVVFLTALLLSGRSFDEAKSIVEKFDLRKPADAKRDAFLRELLLRQPKLSFEEAASTKPKKAKARATSSPLPPKRSRG